MKTNRFLLTAGIAFATAFTISCSGDNNGGDDHVVAPSSSGGGEGGSSSSNGGGSSSSDGGQGGSSSSVEVTCGDWVTTTPATCTSEGEQTKTCSDGTAQTQEIAQLSWGEWAVTTPATCAVGGIDGVETRTCPGDASPAQTRIPATLPERDGKAQFCDARDGKAYVYVEIGTQTWMAENLNYNASGSRCYGDNSGNDSQNRCGTYGRLYNWSTAMNGAASSSANPNGVQGVCPDGWHLPSDAEWTVLTNYVGSSTAGTKLKANSSLWSTNTGTDDYGFSALPGGGGDSDGSFGNVSGRGYWWSSTESNASNAYGRYMLSSGASVYRSNYDGSSYYSVRCVRD